MLADAADGNGMTHFRCSRFRDRNRDRPESVLKDWGTHILAWIDHSLAAAEAGISMRPVQVLLFGNPAVGTPRMIAAPTLGIDLPSAAELEAEETCDVEWAIQQARRFVDAAPT